MYMIFNAIDLIVKKVFVFYDPCYIGIEFAAKFLNKATFTVFCSKNDVV